MSFVCHSYVLCYLNVLVRHSYVTRIYLYVTCITVACNRMSFECTRTSLVCNSHLLVSHRYVTPMYLYVIRMPSICGFTTKQIKYRLIRICSSLASLKLIHVKSSTLKTCANISVVQSWNYIVQKKSDLKIVP